MFSASQSASCCNFPLVGMWDLVKNPAKNRQRSETISKDVHHQVALNQFQYKTDVRPVLVVGLQFPGSSQRYHMELSLTASGPTTEHVMLAARAMNTWLSNKYVGSFSRR